MATHKGIITELVERASGFGFIRIVGVKEPLFFHSDDLRDVRFSELKKGDKVCFSITQTPKGPYAKQVTKATTAKAAAKTKS